MVYWLGDNRRCDPPDTIPNSEVKPSIADDTSTLVRGKVGRCQACSPLS